MFLIDFDITKISLSGLKFIDLSYDIIPLSLLFMESVYNG